MRLNNKGMTLVEIIISVALISIVMGFLFKVILDVNYERDNFDYASTNQINRAEIISLIQKEVITYGLEDVTSTDTELVLETSFKPITLKVSSDKRILSYEEKNRKWAIKDNSYKFGNIEVENILDDEYVKITIPIRNALDNDKLIDDIELFIKYKEVTDFYFYQKVLNDNELLGNINTFNRVTRDGEYGLYSAEDDYGTSYYFRGDVENNNVKFGKNSRGQDLYWKIIRINGDQSVRMMYFGTYAKDNSGIQTHLDDNKIREGTPFNLISTDMKYVGYTFDNGSGVQADSNIKSYVDSWYRNNLLEESDYLADSIFCNDRRRAADSDYVFEGSARLWKSSVIPILTCPTKEDRYTVEDDLGNGYLTYPVGLITADEAVMAGSMAGIPNETFYLNADTLWTMTPTGNTATNKAAMWTLGADGNLSAIWNHVWYYTDSTVPFIQPVINIKANIKVASGNGTRTNPYVLK